MFGVKGGAAGGGYAQVVPMEEINLPVSYTHLNEQLAYYPWPQYEEAKCVESTLPFTCTAISTVLSTHLASRCV